MSDNDGQVQRLQAEARTKDTTIAELRRERDALRTLAGNIYALMIERNEDDCAFVDPDTVQSELRAECVALGVMPWQRTRQHAPPNIQIGNGTRLCPACKRIGKACACDPATGNDGKGVGRDKNRSV